MGCAHDDRRPDFPSGDAPRSGAITCRFAPRNARAAPSTAGTPTVPISPASSCESRPVALGIAVALLEGLADGPCHRETGDRYRLASTRLLVVLVLEESAPHRATTGPGRCPHADSDHGAGQSAL